MSDEEETAYISEEEAANVLSGQIEIYQHIQDQALAVVRMTLAFIGISIAALSLLVTNLHIQTSPFLPVYDPNLVDSRPLVLLVYLSTFVVLVGLLSVVGVLYHTIKLAISILSAPELQPYSTENVGLKLMENSSGNSQYIKLIDKNQSILNGHNSDLKAVYQRLRGATIGASAAIFLGFVTYFIPMYLVVIFAGSIAALVTVLAMAFFKGRGLENRIQEIPFLTPDRIYALVFIVVFTTTVIFTGP